MVAFRFFRVMLVAAGAFHRKQKDPSWNTRGLRVGIVAQLPWPRLGLLP
jgi:hypothetical protein